LTEIDKNTTSTRILDQPIGSDFDQHLLEFLDAEFNKRNQVNEILGRFVPFWGILKGLNMTRKAIFAPKSTIQYPEQKLPVAKGFRGQHELLTDPHGEQLCICCQACANICPVNCIEIKSEPARDTSKRKRDLVEYNVDLTKCLFCNLCTEVCPEYCLVLGPKYEYSDTTRGPGNLMVTKEIIERRTTNEEYDEIKARKGTKKAAGAGDAAKTSSES